MECWLENSWTTIFTVGIPLLLISTMVDQVSSSGIDSYKITRRISIGYVVFLSIVWIFGVSSEKFAAYLGLPSSSFYILLVVFAMLRMIVRSLDKMIDSEFGVKSEKLGSTPVS